MDLSKFAHLLLFEKNRVESFKKWPFGETSSCSVSKMAEAGFYWSGNEREPDCVTCFVCAKTLDGWEPTDDPWKEHQKHAPQCTFVKYGRKEAELTVQEFLNIFGVGIKGHMEQNLNKTKDQLRKWAEKEMEKYLLQK